MPLTISSLTTERNPQVSWGGAGFARSRAPVPRLEFSPARVVCGVGAPRAARLARCTLLPLRPPVGHLPSCYAPSPSPHLCPCAVLLRRQAFARSLPSDARTITHTQPAPPGGQGARLAAEQGRASPGISQCHHAETNNAPSASLGTPPGELQLFLFARIRGEAHVAFAARHCVFAVSCAGKARHRSEAPT